MTTMRSERVDGGKFVLVALVIAGHLLEQVKGDSAMLESAHRFLAMFRIPALVWLSGLVTAAHFDAQAARRWWYTLALPYLVFQLLYIGVHAWLLDPPLPLQLTTPYWLLWYLMSLACWRLMLPLLLRTGHPLKIAIGLALAAGYVEWIGYPGSMSRTLVFLPFFVAGHRFGLPEISPRSRALAIATAAALLLLAWTLRTVPEIWFYGSAGYGDSPLGVALRALLLACGAIGAWMVFVALPQRPWFGSRLGAGSPAAYLLHGFLVVAALSAEGFDPLLELSPLPRLLVLAVVGLAIAVVLSWMARPLRFLFDYRWLSRRRGAEGARAA